MQPASRRRSPMWLCFWSFINSSLLPLAIASRILPDRYSLPYQLSFGSSHSSVTSHNHKLYLAGELFHVLN
jgi:hypothetical protein